MAILDILKKNKTKTVSFNGIGRKSKGQKEIFIPMKINLNKPIFESLALDRPKKSGKGKIRIVDFLKSYGFVGEEKNEDKWRDFRKAYLTVPIVTAAIDITADQIVQTFYAQSDDPIVEEELNLFIRKFNLIEFFHNISKLMLIYGNAFVEIVKEEGEGIVDLKILDPVTMYVNRDEFGNFPDALAYLQRINFIEKPIEFGYDDIVHFKWNPIGESAYGTSLVESSLQILNLKMNVESNLGIILERYASPIIHAIVGSPEEPARQADIDKISADLEDLYADTEFTTDHRVRFEVIGVNQVALNLDPPLTYIDQQLVSGLEVPLSLLGRSDGSNRATAEVQKAMFDRRVKSGQRMIKRIVEMRLFKTHLEMIHGELFDFENMNIQLVWGEPEERQSEANVDMIIKMKQAGIITAQKANDLLPKEFREELPEQLSNPFGNIEKPLDKKDMAKEPNPKMDRIVSARDKRNPKKVERE